VGHRRSRGRDGARQSGAVVPRPHRNPSASVGIKDGSAITSPSSGRRPARPVAPRSPSASLTQRPQWGESRQQCGGSAVDDPLGSGLDSGVRAQVVIRRESYVAGTRDQPEVGIFTQTHTSRPPVSCSTLDAGDLG